MLLLIYPNKFKSHKPDGTNDAGKVPFTVENVAISVYPEVPTVAVILVWGVLGMTCRVPPIGVLV